MTRDADACGASGLIAGTDTVRQALCRMTQTFESAGIDSAMVDARHLLQGVLQIDAVDLIRDPDGLVGTKAALLADAVARRLKREPVSRILGWREFYGRRFRISPDVLDPRADTETVVDLALDVVRDNGRLNGRLTIADIGVGSGAIIATLLAELPQAMGIGTDICRAALSVAHANAAAIGVADRLRLIETRGLQGINAPLNLVVSNPPYIPVREMASLDIDVRNFDPHIALDGGQDGLDVYRQIANDISSFASPCWIILEVGAGQADDVDAIFEGIGARVRYRRSDLGGHIRAVAMEIHR